jgi:hypothetical protein
MHHMALFGPEFQQFSPCILASLLQFALLALLHPPHQHMLQFVNNAVHNAAWQTKHAHLGQIKRQWVAKTYTYINISTRVISPWCNMTIFVWPCFRKLSCLYFYTPCIGAYEFGWRCNQGLCLVSRCTWKLPILVYLATLPQSASLYAVQGCPFASPSSNNGMVYTQVHCPPSLHANAVQGPLFVYVPSQAAGWHPQWLPCWRGGCLLDRRSLVTCNAFLSSPLYSSGIDVFGKNMGHFHSDHRLQFRE